MRHPVHRLSTDAIHHVHRTFHVCQNASRRTFSQRGRFERYLLLPLVRRSSLDAHLRNVRLWVQTPAHVNSCSRHLPAPACILHLGGRAHAGVGKERVSLVGANATGKALCPRLSCLSDVGRLVRRVSSFMRDIALCRGVSTRRPETGLAVRSASDDVTKVRYRNSYIVTTCSVQRHLA